MVFFLIDSLKYLDSVLIEIKNMFQTAFSAPYSLLLKERTLKERTNLNRGYSLKNLNKNLSIISIILQRHIFYN